MPEPEKCWMKSEKDKPLSGKTVVITGTSDDAAQWFIDAGADMISFPVLHIEPCSDFSEFDRTLAAEPDYLVFTSANAVDVFYERISSAGFKLQSGKTLIAAVGARTAAKCSGYGIRTDIIPENFSAAGLLEELKKRDMKNRTVLIPCSEIARDELADGLSALGAFVNKISIYTVSLPRQEQTCAMADYLRKNKANLFVFASPSAYRNFLTILNITAPAEYFRDSCIAAIGPVTRREIESSGAVVSIMPDSYTMQALAEETVEFFLQTKANNKE